MGTNTYEVKGHPILRMTSLDGGGTIHKHVGGEILMLSELLGQTMGHGSHNDLGSAT